MIDEGIHYKPKSLTYADAMRRIVNQFHCSRKEAYGLMKELIGRRHFKLKEEDKE